MAQAVLPREAMGKADALVQVAYTIDGEKTRKRELTSLLGAARKIGGKKLVLFTDHTQEINVDGDLKGAVIPVAAASTMRLNEF